MTVAHFYKEEVVKLRDSVREEEMDEENVCDFHIRRKLRTPVTARLC